MLTQTELKTAIRNAIELVGLENFKRSSMFMSNKTESNAEFDPKLDKAA